MPAYLIADIEVVDPEKYEEYRRQVAATVEKFSGRFLVRGGRHLVLEGEWPLERLVVIEFPSMDALQAWYHSPEYAPLIRLRQSAAQGRLIAIEGA
jgi:uncharacterized protein (DUF1330 family)